ncbi:hypothetical protein DL95DRAFT_419059 [Leptodontidium sp. 2 PMI_412]|nr:hypothetical protein DL95DRAFT_419059 [Leptodontidium sp. 2 PMI_412]
MASSSSSNDRSRPVKKKSGEVSFPSQILATAPTPKPERNTPGAPLHPSSEITLQEELCILNETLKNPHKIDDSDPETLKSVVNEVLVLQIRIEAREREHEASVGRSFSPRGFRNLAHQGATRHSRILRRTFGKAEGKKVAGYKKSSQGRKQPKAGCAEPELDKFGRDVFNPLDDDEDSDWEPHPDHEDESLKEDEAGIRARGASRILKLNSYSHGLAVIEQLMEKYDARLTAALSYI